MGTASHPTIINNNGIIKGFTAYIANKHTLFLKPVVMLQMFIPHVKYTSYHHRNKTIFMIEIFLNRLPRHF